MYCKSMYVFIEVTVIIGIELDFYLNMIYVHDLNLISMFIALR